MVFAIGYIDVLIPFGAGLLFLVLPVRANPPKLPEDKAKALRNVYRVGGLVLIGVSGLYLLSKLAQGRP